MEATINFILSTIILLENAYLCDMLYALLYEFENEKKKNLDEFQEKVSRSLNVYSCSTVH